MKIAPSILASDFSRLADELKDIEKAALTTSIWMLWMAALYLILLLAYQSFNP